MITRLWRWLRRLGTNMDRSTDDLLRVVATLEERR